MKSKYAVAYATTFLVLTPLCCLREAVLATNTQPARRGNIAGAQKQAIQAQARQVQEQALRLQMAKARAIQLEQERLRKETYQQREQALINQEKEARAAQEQALKAQQEEARQSQLGEQHGQEKAQTLARRSALPPPIDSVPAPLAKAIAMPVLGENAGARQQKHFQGVLKNLKEHLVAVPMSQAPTNILAIREAANDFYFKDFAAQIGEHKFLINKGNTFANIVPADAWPNWYQPQANYMFCNGFTLGAAVQSSLNWLRFGWHPYFGTLPEGFVCERNYVPTPWIYVPEFGLWRQAGVIGWAPRGPGFDYAAPISVEVFEPRHLQIRDPYTGVETRRVMNVIYMYNAYYYPQFGRWGYINRHNYFVWLNT